MQNRKQAPAIVATIDLSDEKQRLIQDVIRRMHTGRWPMWQALAMRQVGLTIYEAAQEVSRRKCQPRGYFLIKWSLDVCGISWTPATTRKSLFRMLRSAQ